MILSNHPNILKKIDIGLGKDIITNSAENACSIQPMCPFLQKALVKVPTSLDITKFRCKVFGGFPPEYYDINENPIRHSKCLDLQRRIGNPEIKSCLVCENCKKAIDLQTIKKLVTWTEFSEKEPPDGSEIDVWDYQNNCRRTCIWKDKRLTTNNTGAILDHKTQYKAWIFYPGDPSS
jgi:hypothetical protein